MSILAKIRHDLKLSGTEEVRDGASRYFKEKIKLYGVKTGVVRSIGKKHFAEIKTKNKREILELCDELWQSGYMEEAFIACNWSYFIRKKYAPGDFKRFEKWVNKHVSNWAACDTLCNHTVGSFLEMYPEYLPQLKKWARSKNRWMRRASAVSLIVPARRGKFLKETLAIADLLLVDEDDLVQKGYGWMLKEAGKTHQKEIFDYVMRKKIKMPRTALRYAIEKMPEKLKKKAMEKPA